MLHFDIFSTLSYKKAENKRLAFCTSITSMWSLSLFQAFGRAKRKKRRGSGGGGGGERWGAPFPPPAFFGLASLALAPRTESLEQGIPSLGMKPLGPRSTRLRDSRKCFTVVKQMQPKMATTAFVSPRWNSLIS